MGFPEWAFNEKTTRWNPSSGKPGTSKGGGGQCENTTAQLLKNVGERTLHGGEKGGKENGKKRKNRAPWEKAKHTPSVGDRGGTRETTGTELLGTTN